MTQTENVTQTEKCICADIMANWICPHRGEGSHAIDDRFWQMTKLITLSILPSRCAVFTLCSSKYHWPVIWQSPQSLQHTHTYTHKHGHSNIVCPHFLMGSDFSAAVSQTLKRGERRMEVRQGGECWLIVWTAWYFQFAKRFYRLAVMLPQPA